jgi:hypothetical protein
MPEKIVSNENPKKTGQEKIRTKKKKKEKKIKETTGNNSPDRILI